MHDSPLPRFDLLKIDRYRSMTIQFTRGCPFTCEFCDIIVMYGRRPAREDGRPGRWPRSARSTASALTNIFVVDDNFIGNKKEAKQLLTAIVEWQRANDYPIEFMTGSVAQRRRRTTSCCALDAAGELHDDLHRHRVAADGEPRGDEEDAEPARATCSTRCTDPAGRHRGDGRA